MRRWGAAAAVAAVVALAASWGAWPLAHDDLFWHLATGERMVAERAIPRTDALSFTRHGAPWVDHAWGFSLLAWGVERVAGLGGLVALQALLMALLALAVWWAGIEAARAATGRSPPFMGALAAALTGLALWAAQPELFLRGALFGALLMAATVALAERFRRRRERRLLVAVAGLFLLWANLHAGVLFGLAVVAAYAVEALAGAAVGGGSHRGGSHRGGPVRGGWIRDGWWGGLLGAGPPAPWLAAAAGACLVALVNPYGLDALLYPLRLSRTLFGGELALDLGHFQTADPLRRPAVALLLSAVLAALVPAGSRRPPPLALLLALAGFLAASFRTPRMLVELGIVAVPAAAAAWSGAGLRRPRRAAAVGVAIAALTALVATAATVSFQHRRQGLRGPLGPEVPRAAVELLAAEPGRGRLFHHQNFGGYLGWRLGEPVFWDGRNLLFAPLMHQVQTVPFDELLEGYRIDALLLTAHEQAMLAPLLEARAPMAPMAPAAAGGGRWALVYWDDLAAIYLRRTPERAERLAAELVAVPPFGARLEPAAGAATSATPSWRAAARAELERLLAVNPRIQRALYFLALLDLADGDLGGADRRLAAARGLGPNRLVLAASAEVRERLGHAGEAAAMRRRAAALD